VPINVDVYVYVTSTCHCFPLYTEITNGEEINLD